MLATQERENQRMSMRVNVEVLSLRENHGENQHENRTGESTGDSE